MVPVRQNDFFCTGLYPKRGNYSTDSGGVAVFAPNAAGMRQLQGFLMRESCGYFGMPESSIFSHEGRQNAIIPFSLLLINRGGNTIYVVLKKWKHPDRDRFNIYPVSWENPKHPFRNSART